MIKIFKKNVPIPFKTIGFVPESHLETGNELTDLLKNENDFIWKCHYNFGIIDYKRVNFRNHGDETYLEIDEKTKLFTRFFTTPDLKKRDQFWYKKVGYMGLSFVFNDMPVLQIDTNTYNNIKSINLSVSNTILHFIDGQFDICGQFGYNNGDRNFYFKKYTEKTGNKFLSHDDLLIVTKKCLNILHNVYDDNKDCFLEKEKAIKEEIKKKDVDIQNIADFIVNK